MTRKYVTVDRTWLTEGEVTPPIAIAFDDGRPTIHVWKIEGFNECPSGWRMLYDPDGAPYGNPRCVWFETDDPITYVQTDLKYGGIITID